MTAAPRSSIIHSKPLRLIFAFAILAVLIRAVGIGDLVTAFSKITLFAVIQLIAIGFVMIWVSCIKWRLFIRAAGYDAKVGLLMKLYTMGYFFNSFMPSFVGGDVIRSYQLGKELESHTHAFASTYLERFTGLLAMCFLGTFFVILGSSATKGVELAVLLVSAAACVLALISFSERIGRAAFSLAENACRSFRLNKIADRLEKFFSMIDDAMRPVRTDRKLFLKAMFLSLVFNILTVLNTYVSAQAVGWTVQDVGGLFVVVPLVLLVSMAPVTPSGLGLQEGAFLYFLMRIGASRAEGLGVALVLRAKVIVIAILGGILWMASRERKPA